MKKAIKLQTGLSLIELMIVLTLLSVVLAIGYNYFNFGRSSYSRGELQANVQRDTRFASNYITQQLRFADAIVIDPASMPPNYHYIYINSQGSLVHRDIAGDTNVIIDASFDDVDYIMQFNKKGARLLNFTLDNTEISYTLGSDIQILNISNIEGLQNGTVVQYTIPSTPIWEYVSAELKFWRDFIKDYYQGDIEKITDTTFAETNLNTGELSLQIKGTGVSMGALIFKDIGSYLDGVEGASIENYTITVDAQTLTPEGGWGILINGYTENIDGVLKDNGYMFQFDPGARGFLLRRIKDGSHPTNVYIGATPVEDDAEHQWKNYGLRYSASYAPEHISNEKFSLPTYSSGTTMHEDWLKRYKTVVNVQTVGVGTVREMFITVILVDPNGNQSNPMYFGDFGELVLSDNSKIRGTKLGFDSTWNDWSENGTIMGLRSWNKSQNEDHETNFFSVDINSGQEAWWPLSAN